MYSFPEGMCKPLFYSLDKLKLKTKIFFVGVNENSTTFLYIFDYGDKKTFFLEGGKKFSCPPF